MTYSPAGQSGLLVVGLPNVYHLHDGTSWTSGAGRFSQFFTHISSVSTSGNQISYSMDLPVGSLLYNSTDYDNGDESSYGELVSTAPLVLTTTSGSNTARLTGYAKITVNEPASNAPPQGVDYFNAPIGSEVPFDLTYTMVGGSWTSTTGSSSFQYNMGGTLDFTQAVTPEPAATLILTLAAAGSLLSRRRRA